MTDFVRGALLSQTQVSTGESNVTLFTAAVETEITAIWAAPLGDVELTLYHNAVSGTPFVPASALVYQFPVDRVFQGPIFSAQTPGNGIPLQVGDSIGAGLDAGTGVTLTLYGVTLLLPELR